MSSGRQQGGTSSNKGQSMDATGRIPKKNRAAATQQPSPSAVPIASATSRLPDEDPVAEARKALAMYEEISGESPAAAAASRRNKPKQSSGGGGGGKKSEQHASASPAGAVGPSSSSAGGTKSPPPPSRQSNNGQRKERKDAEELEKRRKRRREAEALRKTFKPRISDSTHIL
mmetsp:Transcript_8423/g.20991  ORF Transcript_8423/g.20991 Transcript_8423/m.20991 type:complete len:173 (+) Transcript_8423:121-639(+)